jgi:hypothetical protein
MFSDATLRAGRVPAVPQPGPDALGARPQRRQAVALQGVRGDAHPGDGHDLRGAQATGRGVVGAPARAALLREPGGNGPSEPQAADHAALPAREAVHGPGRGPGLRGALRKGPGGRDDVPRPGGRQGPVARGEAGRRPLEEQHVHRDRLRGARRGVLRVRSPRPWQAERREGEGGLLPAPGRTAARSSTTGRTRTTPW